MLDKDAVWWWWGKLIILIAILYKTVSLESGIALLLTSFAGIVLSTIVIIVLELTFFNNDGLYRKRR